MRLVPVLIDGKLRWRIEGKYVRTQHHPRAVPVEFRLRLHKRSGEATSTERRKDR